MTWRKHRVCFVALLLAMTKWWNWKKRLLRSAILLMNILDIVPMFRDDVYFWLLTCTFDFCPALLLMITLNSRLFFKLHKNLFLINSTFILTKGRDEFLFSFVLFVNSDKFVQFGLWLFVLTFIFLIFIIKVCFTII